MQNRAAQFVDTVSRPLTAGCVLEAMGSALHDIGIDCFCMNLLATPKQKFEEVILASKLPSDWINLYNEKAYSEDDPSQRHSKRVVRPYDWKDAPYDSKREPRALGEVRREAAFGIGLA